MKKHEGSKEKPSGRDALDARSGAGQRPVRSHDANSKRDRGGLSVDGYRDRSPLTVTRGSGSHSSHSSRTKRSRTMGVIAAIAVLLVAFMALGPLLTGLVQGNKSTTATSRATTAAAAATASASGTATTSSTAAITSAGSTAVTSATTTAVTSTTTSAKVDAATRAQAFAAAKSDFEALVKTYSGRYALYYRNLANGETYTYNASAPFVAASSIKLGINTYLYTQIETGKISASEILTYDSRPYPTGDYEAGTGTIQGKPNGTQFSVRDTSGLSIRISDNCATNMIIRKLGGIDTVNVYLHSISAVVDYRTNISYKNYSGTTVSGRHRSSATDLGLYAVRLYELYKKNPVLYGTLIDDLKKTEFDFGIQKGIPSGVDVAHKIGTNGTYNAENDVGIVFTPEAVRSRRHDRKRKCRDSPPVPGKGSNHLLQLHRQNHLRQAQPDQPGTAPSARFGVIIPYCC